MNEDDFYDRVLAWRSIEPGDQCLQCGGCGGLAYGSTATWRGGVGGQTITGGVCDKCWGSGSKSRPWPSWRKVDHLWAIVKKLAAFEFSFDPRNQKNGAYRDKVRRLQREAAGAAGEA